jgi:hypothetical protein
MVLTQLKHANRQRNGGRYLASMWKARVQFAPIEQPGRIASIPRLPGRRYVEVRCIAPKADCFALARIIIGSRCRKIVEFELPPLYSPIGDSISYIEITHTICAPCCSASLAREAKILQ